MNPREALDAALDLGAKKSIGMHWGTFMLTDEEVTEPPKLLKAALTEESLPSEYFITIKPGDFEPL